MDFESFFYFYYYKNVSISIYLIYDHEQHKVYQKHIKFIIPKSKSSFTFIVMTWPICYHLNQDKNIKKLKQKTH